MCGRFQVNIDEPELLEILNDLQKEGREPPKLGEMYPTELAPALAARNGSVAAGLFRWGYEKFDGKGVLINARAETVREKFIILTKDATPPVSQFHHRIPVLVEKDALGDWLTDVSFASDYLYRDNPVPLIY